MARSSGVIIAAAIVVEASPTAVPGRCKAELRERLVEL